jgi:hypothetical protein
MNRSFFLRVLALVCFILATVGVPALGSGHYVAGLVPLGLALWVASSLP